MMIFYYTFGCKVNQYETENIREKFSSLGFGETSSIADAQVCIVNTCTVTAQSDSKCRQLIRRIRKENPSCILVMAGCMPQAFPNIADKLTECDIIVGSHNKNDIPGLVRRFMSDGKRIIEISENKQHEKIEPMSNVSVETKTRAYIKIQDGCDMNCTYCIIPKARGHMRSKPLAEIVPEALQLINSGHKELILTGINLCCYGRDLSNGTRLINAIEAVCGLDGDFRVRLSSMEPEMISDEDISRMAALDKLCPQFHLSLQSGCGKTLKAMNRHYTPEEYSLLCEKLRNSFSGCAITTDIMVGFPQETEEDFTESLEFARKIAFADAHIFPYSRRSGTAADRLDGQIDKKTKHLRAQKMSVVCNESKKAYLTKQIGTVHKVLFEKETSPEYHQGHTASYILVRVPRKNADVSMRRKFADVLITHCDGEQCYGTFVEN